MTQFCKRCQTDKPEEAFHWRRKKHGQRQYICIDCLAQIAKSPERLARAARAMKELRSTESGWWRLQNARIKHEYGISLLDLAGMYIAQWWRCPVCRQTLDGLKRGTKGRDCIDHDHASGQVRAVIHKACNLAVGYAFENSDVPNRLIDYLRIQR